jgi:phytoene synthase
VAGEASLAAAYAVCVEAGRRHYENFPVASRLLPRQMRPHIAAVYAFARTADDFADEGQRSADERTGLLDGWGRRLAGAAAGEAPDPARPGEPPEAPAVFLALGATMQRCELPVSLLHDLLSAFRQDVHVTRYETWDSLFDYCRRSANPVGRLVLRIAGYRDGRLDRWSDAICTALQLTNFWQDLLIDHRRGRLYVPREEQRAHGALEDELSSGVMGPSWRRALAAASSRTRALFDEGRPLCDGVEGRLRHELRATWLGGRRILDRMEAAGFDVAAHRPTITARDIPWFAWRLLSWSGTSAALVERSRAS